MLPIKYRTERSKIWIEGYFSEILTRWKVRVENIVVSPSNRKNKVEK